MAANADSVVVDLVANVEGFNKNVTDASKNFDQSMNAIEQSAGKAEKAHSRLTLAANNNRVAMLEMGHVVRGSVDQFAAGAPLTQIFAQHIASVGEAASLSGSSLGALGKVMAGPWGLAITAGIAILTTIIAKHKEEGDTVDSLVGKLKEHAEKTRLSDEADRIWTNTLDALIDRQHKLSEELGKRLEVQALTDQADLVNAQNERDKLEKELGQQKQRIANLTTQLAQAKAVPVVGSTPEELIGSEAAKDAGIARAQALLDKGKSDLARLNAALHAAESRITQGQIVIGQTEGKALADLSAAAALFGEKYEGVITQIIKDNPKLGASAAQIEAAGQALISAANDAASAGVDFKRVANDGVLKLDKQLDSGKITVRTYATEIAKLTKQLLDMTEAAKEAAKHKVDPVEQFKQRVFGAEGLGANKLGSSAFGFGQFMPKTFESYFKQLYPTASNSAGNPLSNAEIDKLRGVREVATAVLDAATEDYKRVLTKAGQTITAAGLYTVHLLGQHDAQKFLSAPGGQNTRSVLGNQIVDLNPLLKGTVDQAKAAIAKRIGESSTAISAGIAAIANAAEQEKQREAAYGQKADEIEGQILAARKELGLSAEETAQIEKLAADAAAKKYTDDIKANIIDAQGRGKYTKEEADNLIKLSDARTGLIKEIIDRRLQEAQFREQEAAQQNILTAEVGQLEAHQDLLHSEEQLAKTAKQRKAIEDRLIDLQFDEIRLQLQAQIQRAADLKALADKTKSDEDIAKAAAAEADAARAKAKLKNLPKEQANAHQANAQQNASPLQSFFQSIPQTADEINNALENIAVSGLNNFNNSLTDAIVNFHSLGDVGRAVLQGLEADLIQLALRLIEQHTIGAVLGAAATATTTAAAAAAGAAWAGPAAMASLATLGANAGPASAGIASTVALATVLGAPKAMGGRIFGPGGDTTDGILTPTSRDEFVIKANSARALGYDVLDYINSTGELPHGFANGGAIRPMNLPASGHSPRSGFSPADIRQLEGIVGRAISAMPDIKLYPTVDSGDMFRRGIDTTHGSRALVAHITDNATKYKAAINRP